MTAALAKVSGEELVPTLTERDARALTDALKADARALQDKALDLYERGAHRALGYSSWGAYWGAEFGGGKAYGYRMVEAARVRKTLAQAESPIGDWEPNEAQARELARLDDEQAQRNAWAEAVGWAQKEGRRVTATDVRRAVAGRRPSKHPQRPPRPPTPEPEPQRQPEPAPAEEVPAAPGPRARPTGGTSANGRSPVPESPPPPKSPAVEVAALAVYGRRLVEMAARLDIEGAAQESDEAEVDAWRATWTELRDRADELLERSLSKAEMAKVEATAGRIGVKLL